MRSEYTPGAYDVCITCSKRPQFCNGPRTTGLTEERRIEFARALKEHEGWNNKSIAFELGLAEKTIENYFAGKNVQLFTACAIENLLFGSSGTYPCPLEAVKDASDKLATAQEELDDARLQIEEMKREIARLHDDRNAMRATQGGIHTSYKAELDEVRASYRREIDAVRSNNMIELEAVRKDAREIIDHLTEEVVFLRQMLAKAMEK